MRAYHEKIVEDVICYVAKRYKDALNKDITQTVMFKILALLDFRSLKQIGRPCLEFSYTARKRGPVPEELYNSGKTEYDSFFIKSKKNGEYATNWYVPAKNDVPDLECLSPSEKKILDDILDKFIKNKINGEQASEITHNEINAWKVAYKREPNSQMDYADEFPGIYEKTEDELTIPEMNFLKYKELEIV